TNKKQIFDDFHKIEPEANRFHQGTGIGLSLSKRLVNLMGGELSVDSQLNRGSVFYFTLPRINGPMEQEKETDESQDNINLEKITVLIAEDEPDNFHLIEMLLKKTRASIFWARNGKEAVKYIEENPAIRCLVLMDIKMPVMDGIEACARIKTINNTIPVIAITAYALSEDAENLMKYNFDDFIAKPINFDKLHKSILHLLNVDREK
ncbi:MAG: response regulator, partial [Bacteroidales bacterium]|nr:response regulator [Bacteroidales bacterium]